MSKELFLKSMKELMGECKKEFLAQDPYYGSAWMDLNVGSLKGITMGEAAKITAVVGKEELNHRMVDLINYVIFLYAHNNNDMESF